MRSLLSAIDRWLAPAPQPVRPAIRAVPEPLPPVAKPKVGAVVKTFEIMDAVSKGVLDAGHHVSGEELELRGISNTVDIALSVPGVAVQDRGGSSERVERLRALFERSGIRADASEGA